MSASGGNIGFGQPFDVVAVVAERFLDPFRAYKLDGAGAILAHCTEEGERVAGRYVKLLAPASQDRVVVRQQAL